MKMNVEIDKLNTVELKQLLDKCQTEYNLRINENDKVEKYFKSLKDEWIKVNYKVNSNLDLHYAIVHVESVRSVKNIVNTLLFEVDCYVVYLVTVDHNYCDMSCQHDCVFSYNTGDDVISITREAADEQVSTMLDKIKESLHR